MGEAYFCELLDEADEGLLGAHALVLDQDALLGENVDQLLLRELAHQTSDVLHPSLGFI